MNAGATMTHTLAVLATALVFGGMAFFSFVLAPLVFRVLDKDTASTFLRAAFPLYYAAMAGGAAVAALFSAFGDAMTATAMACVAAVFVALRQILVPAIGRHRQGRAAGDAVATAAFKRLHGLSVLVNMIQLVAVTAVLVRLAS